MADIDLLVELLGVGKAKTDLQQITDRGRQMGLQLTQGLRGADALLDTISGKSKFTAESFVQLTNVIPLLSTGVGAAAVGAGALGLAMFKVVQASNDQKNAELHKELEKIEIKARIATSGWEAYYRAILDGQTKVDAKLAKQDALAKAEFEESKKANEGRTTTLQEDIKKHLWKIQVIQSEIDARKKRIEAMGEETEAQRKADAFAMRRPASQLESKEELQAQIAAREKELEQRRAAMEQTRRDIDAVQESLGLKAEEAAATKKESEETRGLIKAKKDLNEERLLEIEIRRDAIPLVSKVMNEATVAANNEREAQELLATETGIFVPFMIERFKEFGESAHQDFAMTGVAAFDAYADALDRTVSLNQIFAGGFDRSMRNVTAMMIRNIGQRAAYEAAWETAMGLKDTALLQFGTAGVHFASAAAFAGIAAAAGAGAGLVSVKPAGGGAGGGGAFSGRDRGADALSSNGGHTTVFNIIGVLDTEARRRMIEQLQEEIDEGN